MDQEYIESHHIIDRYLMNQLSDQEAAEFELFYFENPEVFDDLRIQEAMHSAMADEAHALLPSGNVTPLQAQRPTLIARVFTPVVGMAATALLAVFGAMYATQQLTPSDTPDIFMVSGIAELRLIQTRGQNEEIAKASKTKFGESLKLTTDLGPIGYSEVILQLEDANNDVVWSKTVRIEPPLGTIELVLQKDSLSESTYSLNALAPDNSSGPPLASFTFQITP